MAKCGECGTALPADARFCPGCGAPAGVKKDVYQVSAEGLVGKIKDVIHEAGVRRILVKDEKGKLLLSIPVTWGGGRDRGCNCAGAMACGSWSHRRHCHQMHRGSREIDRLASLRRQPLVTMTFIASLASCAHLTASAAFLMSNRWVMMDAMSSRFSVMSLIAWFVSTSDAA